MVKKINKNQSGFTIVELAAVIIIIAIITAISIASYTALQQKAQDTAVQSDIDSIEGIVEDYGLKNKLENAYYYSGNPADVAALGFTPSGDDIIDVVTDHNDYCIRGYNKDGTKNSIYNAFTKESRPGVCVAMQPSASAAIVYSGDNLWTQVSSTYQHTCAIDAYGKAFCWGLNDNGQLGNGNTGTNSNLPVAVDTSGVLAGLRIKSIATGYTSTCAIASDDLPYCWGAGTSGQLGNGGTTVSNVPVAVTTSGSLAGKTVKKLTMGWQRACVLASDDYEYCWGNGDNGALGWSGWVSGYSSSPVQVSMSGVLSGKIVKDITGSGTGHSCLIASDNKAYCWGLNTSGQIGDNSVISKSVPVAVLTTGLLSGKSIKAISTNNNTTCVIASDNLPYCWGANARGTIGDSSVIGKQIPTAVLTSGVLTGKNLIGFAVASNDSICAISTDATYYCWGRDDNYQLGDDTTSDKTTPVLAAKINNIKPSKVSVGVYGDCAINEDYALYCWGDGTSGRIGAGNNATSAIPVLITPMN